ncbi:MAG: serine/threonine-protein phosphatase [Opitutaceae bacterium]|nr:serine/threonine-protein phosphatase [Opitutaceae bacterium]
MPAPPLLHLAAVSIVGRKRDHNEDSFGLGPVGGTLATTSGVAASLVWAPPGVLLMVCDGIGGSNAGEVASSLAVATLAEHVGRAEFTPEAFRSAICTTAAVIRAKATEAPGLQGMGTTLTCLWLQGGRALWGQAGDSRGYRWRRPRGSPAAAGPPLLHFTPEHTPVARLVRGGLLTPLQARQHRKRHLIDQALGNAPEGFAPEVGPLELQEGDLVLLCSDGLTDGLDDGALATLLEHHGDEPAAQLAQILVAAANAASGRDNITGLVLRVGEPAAPAWRPFGWLTRWIRR